MGRFRYPRRTEVASAGFDPYRQLNPDAFGQPTSTALFVPPLDVTYTFLLAVADTGPGDRIVGLRQILDLLAVDSSGTPPPVDGPAPLVDVAASYPILQPVVTPRWHFVDGSTTWILTREPKQNPKRLVGPWDQDSFKLRDTEGPALVYESAGFPAMPGLPGYAGLNAYTPPALRGTIVLSVRDLRWPWTAQSNQRLDFQSNKDERWRFYCVLTQTAGNGPPAISSLVDNYQFIPEEGFLQNFSDAQYGYVGGEIIVNRSRRGAGCERVCEGCGASVRRLCKACRRGVKGKAAP